MVKRVIMLGLGLVFWADLAFAACPNQVATVTIPVPGSALVVPVDSTTCAALDATKVTAAVPGSALGTTTTPAFSTDSSGMHLSANGAALGAQYLITFTYAGKNWTMTALVGQTVVPVGTTTTP
jgi:hypothetical protein